MRLRGERLVDLRHLLQLTQSELAGSVDLTPSYVSRLEKGERVLSSEIALRFAARYDLPLSYFEVEDPIPNGAEPTFRRNTSVTAREANTVEASQKLAMRFFHIVSLQSNYVTWRDPVPDHVEDPERAAQIAREFFGLDETSPVGNVTRLLERNGACVITNLVPNVDQELARRQHGVTRPFVDDNRPVVGLVDSGRGDVNRMTLAHELGHLVFDRRRDDLSDKERERRAFDFAGAFLLPAAAVDGWITQRLPLSGYLAIKSQYGVSISAAIQRGYRLGLIDGKRRRSLMIQISSRGWRYDEPGIVNPENPILLGQALKRAFPEETIKDAARATGVPRQLIMQWVPEVVRSDQGIKSDPSNNNVIDFSQRKHLRTG